MSDESFRFEISLSVLNHLGRNLYRNFITIIGEAISNSWDANANNVYLNIDKEKGRLIIRDDGEGMTADDFQNKFLKVGYSKRKFYGSALPSGRHFIGAKGIGKLALLSCSKRVTIISKTIHTDIIVGQIDNGELDEAIKDEITPEKYSLRSPNYSDLEIDFDDFDRGTIIVFEDLNVGISNTIAYIRQQIAMHFRFSTIDENFNIFVDNQVITVDDLKSVYDKTQFLWTLNEVEKKEYAYFLNLRKRKNLTSNLKINGFIASVEKPSHLKIRGSEDKMSVDLFVNGRVR